MRRCSKCHYEGPDDDFGVARKKASGFSSWCKNCHGQAQRDWKARNPEKVRASYRRKSLKRRYGITAAGYQRLYDAQGGLCAVCGQPEKNRDGTAQHRRLAVDHDKVTGKVRGLLCRLCNQRLGGLGDNLAGVLRFIRYLEQPPADAVELLDPPRWSRHYDACVRCDRTDRTYGAYGFCHTCDAWRRRQLRSARSGRIDPALVAHLEPRKHESRYIVDFDREALSALVAPEPASGRRGWQPTKVEPFRG